MLKESPEAFSSSSKLSFLCGTEKIFWKKKNVYKKRIASRYTKPGCAFTLFSNGELTQTIPDSTSLFDVIFTSGRRIFKSVCSFAIRL